MSGLKRFVPNTSLSNKPSMKKTTDHIHAMESDALGRNWTDEVTVIQTERKERLGDKAL